MIARIACQDCPRIDLAEPGVRKALDLRRSTTGTLHWDHDGAEAASAGFDWRHTGRRLIITAIIDGMAMSQTIVVTTTQPNFGGVRLWFVCPVSAERARVLMLAPGQRRWASRAALGLVYASQRMGEGERRLKRLISDADYGRRRNAMRRMLRRRDACA